MEKKEFIKPFNGEVIAEGRISQTPFFLQKKRLLIVIFLTIFLTVIFCFESRIMNYLDIYLFERNNFSVSVNLLFGVSFFLIFCIGGYALVYYWGMIILEIFLIPTRKLEITYSRGILVLREKGGNEELVLNDLYHISITGGEIRLYNIYGANLFFSRDKYSKKRVKSSGKNEPKDIEEDYFIEYADVCINLVKKYQRKGYELGKFFEAERVNSLVQTLTFSTEDDEAWSRVHNFYPKIYQTEKDICIDYSKILRFDIQINFITNELYDLVMRDWCFPNSDKMLLKDFGEDDGSRERMKKFIKNINHKTGLNYQFVNEETIEFSQLALNGRRCSVRNERIIKAARSKHGEFESSFFSDGKYFKLCLYHSSL
jgi:hypothetical protein